MASPIPLMVELCAGTAALSLRLHRDGARPPVSRQGAKTGYADAILKILGLHPGQKAALYLWCEPDPGVRLLLHAYRDARLAREAAAIIRSWAGEDPRALWERLRAEGAPRLPADAGEVARFVMVSGWAAHGKDAEHYGGPGRCGDKTCALTIAGAARRADALPTLPATIAPDARAVDPREVARWAQITASNRLINVAWSDADGRWQNTGAGGTTFGGDAFATRPERTAEGFDAVADGMPAVVTPDARAVDPREVARWCNLAHYAYRQGEPDSGFNPSLLREYLPTATNHGNKPRTVQVVAERFDATPAVPALIHPDARTLDPPALPPGTVVFCDPPYQNTTGYAHDLPRAEVVALARRWAAAGATVAVSEAEPIPELVAEGWFAVEITGERVGQARTFSKQKSEWVTLNRPPAWTPPVQGRLF